MHLWDGSVGFMGSVPIVAGTVPLALGAGLASKLKNDNTIAVAYFGDGAVEEGVVHESLNFASVHRIPILFVVENNLFASHMDLEDRQSSSFTARFAEANGISYQIVDGNNIFSVVGASRQAEKTLRSDGRPYFIEAITYRWLGHVDWREDIDVGVKRSAQDLQKWKLRDPIARLKSGMIANQLWSEEQDTALDLNILSDIQTQWVKAVEDPYPDSSTLISRVYS